MVSLNISSVTDFSERGVTEITLVASVILIIIVVAVVGNIAVIVAFVTTLQLKEELSNVFIINLSVTDLTSAVVVMLTSLIALCTDDWPLGQAWCDVVCMANYCFIIVSMLTLCFISVDRYIAVVRPLHYNIFMTKRRALMMISYSWCQGILFSAFPVASRWVDYDYWEVVCAIQWHQQRQKALMYVIVAVVLCFFIPGLIMVFCYGNVLKTARKKCHVVAPAEVIGQGQMLKYTTSYKAIYSLLVVVMAFFVCMTPFCVTKLYKVAVNNDDALQNYTSLVASIVAYLSSALNPLIYGIFRKDFRSAFKVMFKKIHDPRIL